MTYLLSVNGVFTWVFVNFFDTKPISEPMLTHCLLTPGKKLGWKSNQNSNMALQENCDGEFSQDLINISITLTGHRNETKQKQNVKNNSNYKQKNRTKLEEHKSLFSALCHNNDVTMGAMASQITSPSSLVNSPHIWPVTRKMFPFDGVIMPNWWPSADTQDAGELLTYANRPMALFLMLLMFLMPWCQICTRPPETTMLNWLQLQCNTNVTSWNYCILD